VKKKIDGDEAKGRKKKRKAAPSSQCPRQCRRRGTGWAKSNNRLANEAAAKLSRVSAEFGEALCALHIHTLNQEKDKLFGHLTGNAPKGVIWHLKEANFNHAASAGRQLAAATRPQFPPQEFDDEPIGLEFMRHREWDKIEQMLKFESEFHVDGAGLDG
jgi:hypothetical protein